MAHNDNRNGLGYWQSIGLAAFVIALCVILHFLFPRTIEVPPSTSLSEQPAPMETTEAPTEVVATTNFEVAAVAVVSNAAAPVAVVTNNSFSLELDGFKFGGYGQKPSNTVR